MSKNIKISRGVNIKLKGEAEKVHASLPLSSTVAIKPTDFAGVVPKLILKEKAEVKAGTPLFYSKENDKIVFTSPVSGEIAEIRRGDKRKILEVVILADKEIKYETFAAGDPNSMSREQIIENLLKSGCWPFIRQRPYDVIANPTDTPKSIFISAFDSSPLAPDNDFIVHGNGEIFQIGLDAIRKLTEGKVHLNINAKGKASDVFNNSKGVQINKISGPHPAGLVGVQIHKIDPINKGEKVWYLTPQDVLTIGRLFKEGKFDASRIVAVCGSQVKTPKYFKMLMGQSVSSIINGNVDTEKTRFISGNPLTGSQVTKEGHLGFYDYQFTAIPEGGEGEFFGWIAPGFDKFSLSRTFFSWLMPGKEYDLNTSMNGEERAYVMTGQYEKVFPFDIYPVQLVKAMIIKDIELMESLGVYEVAPEDFALCEYACTSKINVQSIVREGLDLVRAECG